MTTIHELLRTLGGNSSSSEYDSFIIQQQNKNSNANNNNMEKSVLVHIWTDTNNDNNNNEDKARSNKSDNNDDVNLLCRTQFFFGKCNNNEKYNNTKSSSSSSSSSSSGGKQKHCFSCPCLHYSKQYKTLSQALLNGGTTTSTIKDKEGLLNNKSKSQLLAQSENACKLATPNKRISSLYHPGAMKMLYYHPIVLQSQKKKKKRKDSIQRRDIGNEISEILISKSIEATTIVYIVMDGKLLYDRYSSNYDLILSVNSSTNDESSIINKTQVQVVHKVQQQQQHNNNNNKNPDIVIGLPGIVLEHVLSYLPDETVASVSKVCKSWYTEIKHISSNLWRSKLIKRNWPLSYNNNNDNYQKSSFTTISFRDEYIKHYSVIRDVSAIREAMKELLHMKNSNHSKQATISKYNNNSEMVCYDFSNTTTIFGVEDKGDYHHHNRPPQSQPQPPPNSCAVAVEVWSPNHVLVAYSIDCTLRLFKAEAVSLLGKSNNNNNNNIKQVCTQVFCYNINPYNNNNNNGKNKSNKRRISCCLLSMSLDENFVGCLCHVMEDNCDYEAFQLITMSRKALLLLSSSSSLYCDSSFSSDDGNDGAVNNNNIDIHEMVLHYILRSNDDEIDDHHHLQRLHDFFLDGGNASDVEVIVSQRIVACGSGRFMFEAAISIPVEVQDDDDDDDYNDQFNNYDDDMQLIDRRLFLFSSTVGTIIWMGRSNPSQRHYDLRPRHEEMTLCCVRKQSDVVSSWTSCCVAVASTSSPAIITYDVDPSGNVSVGQLIQSSLQWSFRNGSNTTNEGSGGDDGGGSGWELRKMQNRPIIITPSNNILVADTLTRNNNNVEMENNNYFGNNHKQYKSIITFYSHKKDSSHLHNDNNNTATNNMSHQGGGREDENGYYYYDTLVIDSENCEVVRMVSIREHHVVLICRIYYSAQEEEEDINGSGGGGGIGGGGGRDGGHWGGTIGPRFKLIALILHVPTRKIIDRVCLVQDSSYLDYDDSPLFDIPIHITSLDNTIATAMWWKGIVITGNDVRYLQNNNNNNNNSQSHHCRSGATSSNNNNNNNSFPKKKKKKQYEQQRKSNGGKKRFHVKKKKK